MGVGAGTEGVPGQKVVVMTMVSVVTWPRGQEVTVGGQDVTV